MPVSAIDKIMSQALGDVFPGAQLMVFKGRRVIHEGCWGCEVSGMAGVTPDTAFDLASLTKPLVTATLIAIMIDRGQLSLGHRVNEVLAITGDKPVGDLSVRTLLNHSSGLCAWQPWGEELLNQYPIDIAGTKQARDYVFQALYGQTPDNPPVYSDLGYLILGAMIENILDTDLDQAFEQEVARRLGSGLFFVPVHQGRSSVISRSFAATRHTNVRGLIRGVVDDDNAFVMGGVAGHAGLFGSAWDVHKVLASWIDAFLGMDGLVSQATAREFWSYDNRAGGFVLGFDTPTPNASSAGTDYPKGIVGHLGFTGTSFWLDPKTGLGIILLTNRVNPDPANIKIRTFRPMLHDMIWQIFG